MKKKTYKKGKYPYTVLHIKTGNLYVRKSVSVNKIILDAKTGVEKFVRQRQIWRLCEPPTATRSEEILAEIEASISFRQSGHLAPLTNFADICTEFEKIELIEAKYERGKKVAGRRSVVSPRIAVAFLKEYFGHYNISQITFGDLETFKAKRLNMPVVTTFKSRPRSIRSVHYELGFLRQIFNFAYRRRWLERNPFDDGKNLINPSMESRRHVSWSREEEAAALALCTGRAAHLKVVIICIVDGGFRRSELFNLKWSELDWENGIMPAKSYKGKNLNVRQVFMTDRIRETLIEWKQTQKTIAKIADKSLIIGYKDVKTAWNKLRSQIGRPDLHLHDLRHCYASRLAFDAKLPLSLISRLLGHSSTKVTEVYVNAQVEDLRDGAAAINVLNKSLAETKVLSTPNIK